MKRHLLPTTIAALAILSGGLSLAQESLRLPLGGTVEQLRPAPAQPTVAQANTRFKTYTEPGFFSFQYPANWSLDKTSSNPPYLILANSQAKGGGGKAPANTIKTDISLQPGRFDQMPGSERSEVVVTKTERLTINGRPALRRWVNSYGFAFPQVVVTYIRYSDRQTAVLASYYTASNPKAVPLIKQVHQSFKQVR